MMSIVLAFYFIKIVCSIFIFDPVMKTYG